MNHVMLDIETLGKKLGAAVVAIGAVLFDPIAGKVASPGLYGAQFYQTINLESAMDAGLHVDGSTIKWWLGQGDEARREITEANGLLSVVLDEFYMWYPKGTLVWAKSPDFDCAIMEEAFQVNLSKAPWGYRDKRDVRTILGAVEDLGLGPIRIVYSAGTAHKAVDDAEAQAKAVCAAYAILQR